VIADSLGSKPLGSVDKIPANNVSSERVSAKTINISMSDRLSFERAFDIPVALQLGMERDLAGNIKTYPQVKQFLEKYKFFIYN
jgi:hypothetical protein